VYALLSDIETAQRGFIITGNSKMLVPHLNAASAIYVHLENLRRLTRDNPTQQIKIQQLQQIISEKLSFSNHSIEVRKQKGLEEASLLVETMVGENLMNTIRAKIEEMRSEEKRLLEMRIRDNEEGVISFAISYILLMVFVIIALAAVLYIVQYNIKVRNKAERLLRENKKMLRSILDNTTSIIYIKDIHGKYVLVNRQFEEVFNKKGLSSIGKTNYDLFSEESAKKFEMVDQQVIRNDRLMEIEENAAFADGMHTYLSVKFPLHDSENKVYAVGCVAMDITERKNSEQELLKLSQNLDEANKELESFTYSVSHDLRAPLRSIDGYTKILFEEYYEKLDEEGKKTMKVVMRNARKMGQLIDDLLAFSRVGRLELSKSLISMDVMVQAQIAELKDQYKGKSIQVEFHPLPIVMIDNNLMKQVWYNLLSNAFKYSSQKESVFIEIGSFEDGACQVYYVKDNGVGFDMAYVDKLFGVFQRLHKMNEFEGTGVGLAIVKRIILKHQGNVWAEGCRNRGATFYFSLPKY
jgi:PAS domain S-box-containing protein